MGSNDSERIDVTLNLTYGDLGDACAAAHALDLIGDRWSLIVVRELMFGPRTARDLESSVIGVSADELKDRLQFLEHAGVLVETELGYITKTTAYALTPWGRELEAILGALGRWAHGSTRFPIMTAGMTPSGVMVAMRTMVPAGSATTPEPISVAWELTDARRPDAAPRDGQPEGERLRDAVDEDSGRDRFPAGGFGILGHDMHHLHLVTGCRRMA
jgi:DNA-binding HxlR family transcriptional regulator